MKKNFGHRSLSSLPRTLLNKRVLGSNPGGKLCPRLGGSQGRASVFGRHCRAFRTSSQRAFPFNHALFEQVALPARSEVARNVARQSTQVSLARARRFPAPAARAVLSGSRS